MTTELLTIGLSRWTLAIGLLAALVLTLGGLQTRSANAETVCSNASLSVDVITKNNKKYVPIDVQGMSDLGDGLTLDIFSIYQDELVGTGKFAPDAIILGPDGFVIRAERDAKGDGRVYGVIIRVLDSNDVTICSESLPVSVPKGNHPASGTPQYNSTVPG
ncbi:MAG: hypothetical protein FI707_10390 [SAR202 cluster bacterium]|jgi:hypothetical protein|nr:hypothetical protein [Chloroflexota bacterium]MDP6420957.1 hypothetical protein [SAR202 cluster bacterium]HAL49258.1 hypothetical protein [Dehalococcoidia bacterium]MDP6665075.1 hypothetical protein [SAR202 cluster bacterium]MDP6799909.1 hypothetical protein [SAR202 cluster bacterium]|tara:strand:- start:8861 stop:9343 length:483 start_codon:yes stop_codon:yes gene_type:complete